ncbi:MAG: serine/threonine-protein kinase, partial [Phycisphaerae bacterium]
MTTEQPDEKAIFGAALAKESREEREAYLRRVCGGNAELLARLRALLEAHEEAGDFLEQPALGEGVTLDVAPLTEGPGTIVGRYKLLEQIGEGGMGMVYMAEQTEPVRRRVALKIIKLGMDTKQVVARFEAERQALALMDHPNIARVLDAGSTETGRPYFVMDLVRGIPITEYCDKNKLATFQRLELFMQVCRAVQHAHQKGIIHRDIKPSNVMVSLHDGKPVPKVIDFGIAKAMNQRLTEKTLFTGYAQMIGTPAYMSPEQAEMSGLDVDTRSDIYSLGVLLYELLTGTTPLEEKRLRRAGYNEIQRIIREEEPPRPSVRLSTMKETLTSVAAHRGTDPVRLGRLVRDDLDWIVMKALEKDRTRRYETPSNLAEDIRRHLGHEPVTAGPPGAAYRLRKFVGRHQVGVGAGLVVSASLVVGLAAATIGFVRASSESRRAQRAERQA